MAGIKFVTGPGIKKHEAKLFEREFMAVNTPDKASAFMQKHMDVTPDMATMSSLVAPLPNHLSQMGLGLFSYYARVTGPDPDTGKIVSGELDLTRALEAAPTGVRHLLEEGLKMACGWSINKGVFTQIDKDNYLEYVRIGTERFVEEHERAERAEKKLAEREAEFARLSAELIESHEASLSRLKQQHQDELRSARQTMDACLRADAEKIEAADRRAQGWKRACRGIRQRYQHWKVAAITAYNILEGRNEPTPVATPVTPHSQPEPARLEPTDSPAEAAISPESPPEPVPTPIRASRAKKIPDYKPLTPEERLERMRQGGKASAAARWGNKTPEERRALVAAQRGKGTMQ